MSRLLSTVVWDIRLQLRYGFFYAGAFVAVVWIVLLKAAPLATLNLLLPPLLFLNLVMTTFYFIGGLVLLEKGQGTLSGLVVTPLRRGEYLAAKVITLTILAALECVLITGVVYGFGLNWLLLFLGLAFLAVIYTFAGFVSVSRYDSINKYIMPSGLVVAALSLPLIDYFGLWPSLIFYVLPTQPPLLLLKSAFQPLEAWQMVYAVLFSMLWIGIGYRWSRKAFYRFIVNN